MAHELDSATVDAPPRPQPRGRRMAFLTFLIAGAYLGGTDLVLNGGDRWHLDRDGVRTVNLARLATSSMLGGGLFGTTQAPTAAERAAYLHVHREFAAVEGATYIWQRVMWGLSGLLAATAILSWITPWGRAWHLLAALAILLVAFVSLACLRYLEIPDGQGIGLWPLTPEQHTALAQRLGIPEGGGLPPRSASTYLTLGTILSAYGWVLILVFLRRSAPVAAVEQDAQQI